MSRVHVWSNSSSCWTWLTRKLLRPSSICYEVHHRIVPTSFRSSGGMSRIFKRNVCSDVKRNSDIVSSTTANVNATMKWKKTWWDCKQRVWTDAELETWEGFMNANRYPLYGLAILTAVASAYAYYEWYRTALPRQARALLSRGKDAEYLNHVKLALRDYNAALDICVSELGYSHEGVTTIMDRIADINYKCGNYSGAFDVYNKILQGLLEEGHTEDSYAIVELSIKLAYAVQKQNNIEAAEKGYRWCIEKAQKRVEAHGESPDLSRDDVKKDRVLLGIAVEHLALFLLDNKRLEEAAQEYERAVALSIETLGDNQPQLAIMYNNLATIYENQGRLDKAKVMLKLALYLSGFYNLIGLNSTLLHNVCLIDWRMYGASDDIMYRLIRARKSALRVMEKDIARTIDDSISSIAFELGIEKKKADVDSKFAFI